MKHWKTTVIGICEATLMGITAESLFDLSWSQRAAIVGLALLRATFAVLAADAKEPKDVG